MSHTSTNHPSQKAPWIVDTGATDHMICSTSFSLPSLLLCPRVKLLNGAITSVTHIGNVKISDSLILTGVLCVPSFNFNLISASKLIKHLHCCLIFRYGLYYLLQPPHFDSAANSSSRVFSTSIKDSSNAEVWHYKLGHPSSSRINLFHQLVPSVPCDSHNVCTICPLAKQHRFPFSNSTSVSKSHFDLIHCDIWGPFSTKSINGSTFFLTIVDNYSRFTWVHVLQQKSQTRLILQASFHLVLPQFQLKIKCLR
jgi:hypothetical protein